ncbi:MAG: CsgE family curli-type amyloid fiber assembly protein [Pseudomonadota bacterium]
MRKNVFWSLLFCVCQLHANETVENLETSLGGLVVDRTISRFGKDFYREFSMLWQETPKGQGLNVVIVETNVPRSGTVLWVEVQHLKIYQTFFGRRSESTLTQRVRYAVQRVAVYVASQNQELQNNPDLVGDGY